MPHFIVMAFFATLFAVSGAYCETQQASFSRAERYFSDSLFNPALKEFQKFLAGRPAALNPTAAARQDSVEESTAFYKIAICLTKLKENAKAADAFDDFVRLFPKDGRVVDVRFLAAMAQKASGNLKEASERFFQVWRRFPTSGLASSALYEAAGCSQSCGDNNHAIDLFAQFCESYGGEEKSQDATISLVKLLLDRKDVAAAGTRLESAEKRPDITTSFLSRILYYKALLASLAGKPEPAGRFYGAMLSQEAPFPEKEEALLNYIAFANDRKDFTTGLSLFKKGADLYQEKGQALSREYLLSWAQTAQNCGAFPEEEKLYRRALGSCAQDSLSSKIMILLSRCQQNRHDLTGMFETLQSLSSKDSLSEYGAQAVLALADLYGGQAAYDDAIAAYRRYCRMKGAREADRALFAIGTLYQEKYHRLDAAAQEYESLLRHYGESPFYHAALFALAQCEEEAGGIQAAVQRYYRVVESDAPKDLIDKARQRMSYLSSFRATNLENAVRLLAEIAQKKADSSEMAPRLMHVAGIYENDLRDYDRALSLYDQVPIYLRNPPDSVTGRLLLCKARVYEKLY
jgi:tetratricopeptide (TPR) repeat protein